MGVKLVDAFSKTCCRVATVGAVAVEAVLSTSRLISIARAALSTRAARELEADSGTGTAKTDAVKTRATKKDWKSIL